MDLMVSETPAPVRDRTWTTLFRAAGWAAMATVALIPIQIAAFVAGLGPRMAPPAPEVEGARTVLAVRPRASGPAVRRGEPGAQPAGRARRARPPGLGPPRLSRRIRGGRAGGGGQEEPGWRGFLLDRLQARFTPLAATLPLGVIWGLWHLPIYGTGFVGPMMFVFFYTWLWNRTRSLLLCVVLHGSFTAALDNLFLMKDSLTVDLAILGTLVGGAISIVLATRRRLGFDRSSEMDQREPAPVEVSGVAA